MKPVGRMQGVGKSCLVLRYVRGQFDPSSKVTVGAAFMSHSVHLPDGTTVKFEIWCCHHLHPAASMGGPECCAAERVMVLSRDTAGQERYASLAPLYYRWEGMPLCSHACLCMMPRCLTGLLHVRGRGASAAAVVYDITNAESFQKAKHWVSELQKNASGDIGVLAGCFLFGAGLHGLT